MRRLWWLLVWLLAWSVSPVRVVQAEGAGFTVTPVLPKNQLGGDTGWFNLLVKPGQTQELPVIVANQSAKPKRLHLTLTNAYTQANGQVGYAPHAQVAEPKEPTLTAIGSKPLDVTLAAHTGRQVTFRVTPPATSFAGQMLGAIYVQDRTANKAQTGSGFAIANQFAMVVAVQLQESTQLVAPALRLASVSPNASGVVARLQNTKARLFGKMTLTTKIVAKATKVTVLTQRDTNYQMAPKTAFDYQLRTTKALPAGDYTVQIVATAGKYRWELTRALRLSAQAAAKLAPPTTKAQAVNGWWLGLIGLLGLLLLGVWLKRRRRKGRE